MPDGGVREYFVSLLVNLAGKPILRATFLTLPLDAPFSLSLSPFRILVYYSK